MGVLPCACRHRAPSIRGWCLAASSWGRSGNAGESLRRCARGGTCSTVPAATTTATVLHVKRDAAERIAATHGRNVSHEDAQNVINQFLRKLAECPACEDSGLVILSPRCTGRRNGVGRRAPGSVSIDADAAPQTCPLCGGGHGDSDGSSGAAGGSPPTSRAHRTLPPTRPGAMSTVAGISSSPSRGAGLSHHTGDPHRSNGSVSASERANERTANERTVRAWEVDLRRGDHDDRLRAGDDGLEAHLDVQVVAKHGRRRPEDRLATQRCPR